jgi:NTP pyrophosphatase (non-canonical NTP hydrolase)
MTETDDPSIEVLGEVLRERARQNAKWGEQNHHPMEWLSILGEEVGEACEAANEAHWHASGRQPWAGYRKELVQVAAVAVAAIEALDRRPT